MRALALSGLAQASGTPMRMLAGARTALQTKRAFRSQLSQVLVGKASKSVLRPASAGRRVDFEALPIRILPKSGPEA